MFISSRNHPESLRNRAPGLETKTSIVSDKCKDDGKESLLGFLESSNGKNHINTVKKYELYVCFVILTYSSSLSGRENSLLILIFIDF
jgi:hypothetical protein